MLTYKLVLPPHSRPLPTIKSLYQYDLVNCPGKVLVAIQVKFPPNGASPPHRHGGASVIGYVLEGTTLNKMNDEPIKKINQGESWYEAPGCHHKVSENHSKTDKLTMMATMVLDKKVLEEEGPGALLQVDDEYKDIVFPHE